MPQTENIAESQSVYSIQTNNGLVNVKTKGSILRQKRWLYLLIAVIVLLVILLLIFIIMAIYSLPRHESKIMICDNEECIKIAASLKEAMNKSVDPCDDFYSYVCGRWKQEHPIPDSKFTHSWFDEGSYRMTRVIRDKLATEIVNKTTTPRSVLQAQILYRSCINIEALNNLGLDPLYSLLKKLNMPIVPSAFINTTADFVQQMARVKRILGMEVFIGTDVIPDPRNNSRNIVTIGAPNWESSFPGEKKTEKRLRGSARRKYQRDRDMSKDKSRGERLGENGDGNEAKKDAEKIFIYDTIKEVISNGTADHRICKSAMSLFVEHEDKINDVVEQIYAVSEYLYLQEEIRFNETDYNEEIKEDNYMTIDELQQITDEYVKEWNASLEAPEIWRRFIDELFQDIIESNWSYKNRILVWDLDYLKSIAVYFAIQDVTVLETYIWWTVVESVTPYSSETLRKIRSTYYKEISGNEIQESRSFRCAATVDELMGMAVAWLFVDPTFHVEKSPRVIEMLVNIRTVFSELVLQSDWMDQQTKIATLKKNAEMKYIIGYPEWLFEDNVLDMYYQNIDLSEDYFLDNMLQLISDDIQAQLNNLFVDNEADDALALNYGAIGSILGHELTHGFDNVGRQYDSDGNYRQWWTNATISEYIEKSRCFIDHYNSYYVEEVDEHINGELTLGENIADYGGLKEALLAYRLWTNKHGQELYLPGFMDFTHEQLLFLAFAHTWCEENTETSLRWMLADTHCPAQIRLHGVLKNLKEFSETWLCPIGSNMNPRKKCRLW